MSGARWAAESGSDRSMTANYVGWPGWSRHLVLFPAALTILILRRPETLTQAEFWNEDGQVFYVGSFFGTPFEQFSRSYAGYLHAVPRVVAWLERLVDTSIAPFVGNGIALLVVAGIASWIASDRLAAALPSRPSRIALAAQFVLLPGSWETLGSTTLVQFYLGIFLVLASLTASPTRRWVQAAEIGALVLAGLSGPFSILFAPLYVARAWLRRDRWTLTTAVVVGSCGAIQAVAVLLGDRSPEVPTAVGAAGLLVARAWSSVIGDFWLSAAIQARPSPALVAVATGMLAWLVVALIGRLTMQVRATIAFAAIVSVVAALTGREASFPDSTYLASRYFLIPTFLVALALAAWFGEGTTSPGGSTQPAIVGHSRMVGIVVAGLFVVGVVGDFSLPRRATHEWAVRSRCIGGPLPCTVAVEYPNAWSIHWPGSNGVYVQPTQSGETR